MLSVIVLWGRPSFALVFALLPGCSFWTLARADASFDAQNTEATVDAAIDQSELSVDAVQLDQANSDTTMCDGARCGPANCTAERADILPMNRGLIDTTGLTFSSIAVWGPHSCPLLTTPEGRSFAASSHYGQGRVIYFGHENVLQQTPASMLPILFSSIHWAAQSQTISVGIDPNINSPTLLSQLSQSRLTARIVPVTELAPGVVNVWLTAGTTFSNTRDDRNRVLTFVQQGGGLVVAGQSLSYARMQRGSANGFPGNQLVSDLELFATPSPINSNETSNGAINTPPSYARGHEAMAAFEGHLSRRTPLSTMALTPLTRVLNDVVDHVPFNALIIENAIQLHTAFPAPAATEASPIIPAMSPEVVTQHRIAARILREGSAPSLTIALSTNDFPGPVNAPAERREVQVTLGNTALDARYTFANASAPVWRSTGLYVRGGRVVSVNLPSRLVNAGIALQVGMHDRTLWNENRWIRAPELVRQVPAERALTLLANPYGGIVYVLAPAGNTLGPGRFDFDGIVPMPIYTRGSTPADAQQWRTSLSSSPAPWSELRGNNLTITLSINDAMLVQDPEPVLAFWDATLEAMNQLAGNTTPRPRLEQLVFDRQLPGGVSVLHGYPTVRAQSSARQTLDLAMLRANGDWETSSAFGRSFVTRELLIPGAEEAFANLFNIYAFERVVGRAFNTAPAPHPQLTATERQNTRRTYVMNGKNFARDWNGWTALETLLQLREALGWNPFLRAMAALQTLPDGERPNSTNARIHQWVLRTSLGAGVNLVPFYEGWGFPIAPETRMATQSLPAFSPLPPLP